MLSRKRSVSLMVLYLLSLPYWTLFCQEADPESNDYDFLSDTQNENAANNTVRQPFSWESAGDVLKYGILIEKKNETTGKYEQYFTYVTNEEETESCIIYIEPMLPPGNYRSVITVYNILGGIEEDMTAYDEFEVHKAYKPEIRSVSYPLYMRSIIYLDDFENDGIIDVEGQNLFMPATGNDFAPHTEYSLKGLVRRINPIEVISHDDERNRKISLQFDMRRLSAGTYHLYARDASGLHSDETAASELVVKFKKWFDLDIEGGYMMPVILHDGTLPEYMDAPILPLSAQVRVTFIPLKFVWGYIGVGLRATYSRYNGKFEEYPVDGNMETGHILFLYQLPVYKRRLFVEFHAGAGFTHFNEIKFHFSHGIDSEFLNTFSFSAEGGVSALYYINTRLYAEAGLDYVYTVNDDMNVGMLVPSVGIGWPF